MPRTVSRTQVATPEVRRVVDEVTATAYHEAGHAVICFAKRFGCYSVSIVPEDDSLGRFQRKPFEGALRPDCDLGPRTERLTRKLIVVALAGFAAEHRLTGYENWDGAADDKRRAVDRCANLRGEPDEVARLFAELLEEAKVEVGRVRKWAAIRRLAIELLIRREIPGAEIELVIGPILRR